MADFVAVIRRTVDGLSENTPEMRDRVYEKARSAVRRQLENMNPRPSDDMINRQLNKLEQAINEVESEHAEALPAVEETEAVEPSVIETPAQQEQPAPADQDAEPAAAAEAEAEAEEVAPETPVDEPTEETAGINEPALSAPRADDAEITEAASSEEDAAHGMAEEDTFAADAPATEPEQEPSVQGERPIDEADEVPRWVSPAEEPPIEREVDASQEQMAAEPAEEDFHREHGETQADAIEPPPSEPPLEAAPPKEAPSEWELPEWEETAPVAKTDAPEGAAEAPEHEEPAGAPERLGMHPVEHEETESEQRPAEAETARSWSFDDSDPFATAPKSKKDKAAEADISEWSWPVEKAPAAASHDERAGTWDHIDDLLGFDNGGRTANGAAGSAKEDESSIGEPPASAPVRPTSYRATPKPARFNIKRLVIGLVIALLLGGGGYAYWQNREAGNAWLSAMIAKIMPAGPDTPETPAGQTDPADRSTEQSGTQDDTAPPEAGSTKFTQRLLADGSERDEGAAGMNGTAASQEGKSVAPQTETGQVQNAGPGAQQAAAGQASAPATDQNAGPAAQPEISVADGEKMFLYEERLGQSSPTAIPGTVAWSIKEESPGGDTKPEPAIQAQITVPDRGLTALMTIKRNADPSLPASHVIEFVFSLPENFEGGSIDGVQRVSMKRTEQDRGDPLIAVPAKITDDFHMIALNDFAEAVGNNTELLRSRSWIDIPITYRNGRRALLTLEKGASGTEAFTKAMQAWGALGSTATSGQ